MICHIKSCSHTIYPYSDIYCKMHYLREYRYGIATPTVICFGCRELFIWHTKVFRKRPYCDVCLDIIQKNVRYIPKDFASHIRYGITLIEYLKLLKSCNYKCQCCGSAATYKNRLQIDHDHSCCPRNSGCRKCIRGLLCSKCNLVMGYLEKNPGILDFLTKYRNVRAFNYTTIPDYISIARSL